MWVRGSGAGVLTGIIALGFCAQATARPLPTGPPATAADLAPRGCIDDDESGPEDCAVSTDGLAHATAVVVSPDGNSVYATAGRAFGDMAVVSFARDPATGALTPLGCIDDVDVGPDTCAQSTVGLDGAAGIAVSPDGTSVYVVSESDMAIVRFDRDPASGVLTPRDCISDPDPTFNLGRPAATCAQSTDGLGIARGVAVSSDGLSVYVVSYGDSAVVRFDRDPATGALTPAGCIDDDDSGPDTCAQSTDGLSGAFGGSSVALDRRGESLYVASAIDHAVVEFARDPATKGISPLGCIDDIESGPESCRQSTAGLGHADAVAVSPDGGSVYAGSQVDGALVRFSRDSSTGLLTPQGCIEGPVPGRPPACAQSAPGVYDIYGIAIAPSGRSVYTITRSGTAVGFERDTSSGALTPASCITDDSQGIATSSFCGTRAQALDNAFDIAISPDGTSAYAASQGDHAIQIFGFDAPDTSLRTGPKARTDARIAIFRFTSEKPGSTFACGLDGRAFRPCTSPRKVRVKPGRHTFQVQATSQAGDVDSSPASYNWKVTKR